jgi:3-hydroxybutyryl-CoA dehydrogenase
MIWYTKASFEESSINSISKNLNRMVKKGKLSKEMKSIVLSRIRCITDFESGIDVDLVIEALMEDLNLKQEIFKKLDNIIRPDAIFASNTSKCSITAIGSVTNRVDKIIGLHFFDPVQVMKFVEITKGVATSEKTLDIILEVVKEIGKVAETVDELLGFSFYRILIPVINEVSFLVMDGVASPKEIDESMKLGTNHPIGPLALADMVGIDFCLSAIETIYNSSRNSNCRPCPLLNKMVMEGSLGCKTSNGFYQY